MSDDPYSPRWSPKADTRPLTRHPAPLACVEVIAHLMGCKACHKELKAIIATVATREKQRIQNNRK